MDISVRARLQAIRHDRNEPASSVVDVARCVPKQLKNVKSVGLTVPSALYNVFAAITLKASLAIHQNGSEVSVART